VRQRTLQQAGRDYEAELPARYGGHRQPASGAGPKWKLDWKLGSLLASVKKTKHRSYRITAEELLEMHRAARGPGGRGETPCMVISIDGAPDDAFVLLGSDLQGMLQGEIEAPPFASSRRAAKLAAARRG
jgi:hypothetical protein